jgi:hypothetical protein
MASYNTEKEVAKLDPNGPDYDIFVRALRRFDGLTAEELKEYVEHHGLIVDLLSFKETMTGSSVERDLKANRI